MSSLVLKRKRGQAIVIDGPATVRVIGGTTRIRITAEQETQIDREEVLVRKAATALSKKLFDTNPKS